jgi:hypothetical protein
VIGCLHVRERLEWIRRQMEDDRTDVPERLLRQIHFEIAAGRRRARRAAALHPGSREHAERVDIWESLDAECEELRHLALGTVDSPAMTSGAGNQ